MSWGTALLPFMDQAPLFNQYDPNRFYIEPQNHTVSQRVLPVYLCPSAPKAETQKMQGDSASFPGVKFGRSDYGGNWGERAIRCYGQPVGCQAQNNYPPNSSDSRGPFTVVSTFIMNNVSTHHVTDGLTQTIFVGESPEALHGLWAGHKNFFDQSAPLNARNAATSSWQSCVVGATSPAVGRLGCDFGQEFHSYHGQGAMFLLGDGSARFVSENLELRTFAALLSYKGGELIGEF